MMRSGVKSLAPLAKSAGVGLGAYEFTSEASRSQATSDSTGSFGYHPSVVEAKNMQPSPGVLSNLPEYRTVPSQSLLEINNGKYQTVHRVAVDNKSFHEAMNRQVEPVSPWYQKSTISQPKVPSDAVLSDVDTPTPSVEKNQYSKLFNFGAANRPVGGFLGGSLGGSMAYRIPNGQSKSVEQKQSAKFSEQQTVEQPQSARLMITYDPNFSAQKSQSPEAQVASAQQVVVAVPTQKQVQDQLLHNYFTGRQADNFYQPMSHLLRTPVDAKLFEQPQESAPLLLKYDKSYSSASEPAKIGEQHVQVLENQSPVEFQQVQQAQQVVAPELVVPEFTVQSLSTPNSNRPIINVGNRKLPKKVTQFIEPVISAENKAASAAPIELQEVAIEVPKEIEPRKKQLTAEEIDALKNSQEAQAKRRMRAENKKAFESRDVINSNPEGEAIPGLNWKISVEYENYMQNQSPWAVIRMMSRVKNWILEKLNYRPSQAEIKGIDTKVQELATKLNDRAMTAAEFAQQVQLLAANIQGLKIRGSLIDQNNMNNSDFVADFVA